MTPFTNRLIRLTTWLYYKKYISKRLHDYFMVEIASYIHENRGKRSKST